MTLCDGNHCESQWEEVPNVKKNPVVARFPLPVLGNLAMII